VAVVREVLVKILANPALLRAMVVLFCAGFAFLAGVLFIRFLRQQIAEESDLGEDTPRSLDALPLHVYNTVIQQLKQQKHELMIQSQAEQQRAKSSESLNQAVLANVPCGVLIFGPNGLVRSINPAAKTILGFATMIGMSPEDIFRGALVRKDGSNAVDEPVALAEEVRAVLHEGSQRRQVEGEYETPAGDQRFIEMTVASLKGLDGISLGVACLITDLSELENTRKERASHAEVSAEMALKLRASLRSISGYGQQLAANTEPQLASQLATDIAQEAAELDRLLGGFLTSAQPAAANGAAAGS
jgi:PAS domain S-box-containing protein